MPENQPDPALSGVFCLNCGAISPGSFRFCTSCGYQLARRAADPEPADLRRQPPALPAVAYMGFWIRALATVIDGLAVAALVATASSLLAGQPELVGWLEVLAPLLYLGAALAMKSETPGKRLLGLRVVDAQGNRLGLWRSLLREIPGKLLSVSFLGLGFLWVTWDRRKRGWHDYLGRSYVVRKPI